jgi:hypothetical protein
MRIRNENERPKAEQVKDRKVKKRERSKDWNGTKNRTNLENPNQL